MLREQVIRVVEEDIDAVRRNDSSALPLHPEAVCEFPTNTYRGAASFRKGTRRLRPDHEEASNATRDVVDGEHCVAIVNIDTIFGVIPPSPSTFRYRTDRLSRSRGYCDPRPMLAATTTPSKRAFEAELPSAASNCFRQPSTTCLTIRQSWWTIRHARTDVSGPFGHFDATLRAAAAIRPLRRRPRCRIPRRLRPRCGASAVGVTAYGSNVGVSGAHVTADGATPADTGRRRTLPPRVQIPARHAGHQSDGRRHRVHRPGFR